ncbi:Histidine kinase [Tenacibaculum sp. 190524A02b]|uniref:sensor histidine kinase n=1 Tax=Tenacibaculum vairaonense TaxID=3137860 RepID=UPI0032B151DF
MKISTNKRYITFLFISWQILFFIYTSGPNLLLIKKEVGLEVDISINLDSDLWLKGFICGVLAFLLSFGTSFIIENKVNLNNPFKKYIFKALIIFLIVQLLYTLLIWFLMESSLLNIESKDYTMLSLEKIYNSLYFFIFNSISLFIFLMIKAQNRLKNAELKQLSLEANLKESQLDTLKGQLNPHFMFNNLNNIRGLMLENVPRSREMITRLSEMLRYSLTKNKLHAISLEEELEMVDNYVAISKIQMEERLQFEKEILINLEGIQIPPMIIQMLIENAIKHGIAQLKKGGRIKLTILQKHKMLYIKVSNTGQLQMDSDSTRLGVENIKQRLALLYKGKASFILKEENNQVLATIKIPLL